MSIAELTYPPVAIVGEVVRMRSALHAPLIMNIHHVRVCPSHTHGTVSVYL